jgi:hypothetical protein
MKTTLERQTDGNYKLITEPETEARTVEMRQESVEETLSRLGINLVKENSVTMEQPAFLDKLTNVEVGGVPVGAAAVGSALAILVDRLVLAKVDPTNKWGSWANLGAAFVIGRYGGKFMGRKSADAAALILTYEAVADWVTQAMNKIMPSTATINQAAMAQPRNTAVNQATKVAENYYASAFGG